MRANAPADGSAAPAGAGSVSGGRGMVGSAGVGAVGSAGFGAVGSAGRAARDRTGPGGRSVCSFPTLGAADDLREPLPEESAAV